MSQKNTFKTFIGDIPKNLFSGFVVSLIALPLGLGLALAYVLSKRTVAYTGFNATKWKDGAGATDAKVHAFAVGVKHTF